MSLPNLGPPDLTGAASRHLDRFRSHWRLIVGFGILSLVLGVAALALSVLATLTSVVVIGILMMVAGSAQILIGFRTRSWGRFIAYELAGLVYILTGLFAVFSPIEASVVLTLLVGAALVATGVSRLVAAAQMSGSPSRSTLVIAGIATALLGVLIVVGWPANSLFILGTLIGIDLLFQGVAWTIFGLRVRPQA